MKLRNKKTGEIIDKICIHICSFDVYGNECKEIDTETRSLEKVLENWEDYTPKEPLIKDEEIRKTVRGWAEINDIEQVSYDAHWNAFRSIDFAICFNYDFDRIDGLRDTGLYTIAELCGEEEE